MSRIHLFGLGLLARIVSALTDCYSNWIWQRLAEGAELSRHFLEDLWEFGRFAMEELTSRWCGFYRSERLDY